MFKHMASDFGGPVFDFCPETISEDIVKNLR
jgi:hypothetical protein